MNAEDWIVREDSVTQKDRVARLQWLLQNTPQNEIWLYHGGLMSHELFEQTRYCYVYGQFLATIILGLSFIENTLGAMFFTTGRNDLEKANISTLIAQAFIVGWINSEEEQELEQARTIRNDVTHFRKPAEESSIIHRIKTEEGEIEILLEQKAREVMLVVFKILSRFSVR